MKLKPIEYRDIEKLRIWRNRNKDAFFYNKSISKKEQIKWFEGYSKQADSQLYIIKYQNKDIGCIGYRPFKDCIELYNVIIDDRYSDKGLMSKAFNLLCGYLNRKIIIRVLNTNEKAIIFYIRNGGKIIDRKKDHVIFSKLC